METNLLTKAGKEVDIIMSSCPLDQNDWEKGVVFTITDITDIKQIQKDLEVARRVAERSDRLKSAFLANMSHEIRTPMNAIVGFSELLQDDDLEKERKDQFVNLIVKNSNQLLNLVNDVLDISRIEAGEVQLRFESVLLAEFMTDMQAQYELRAAEKGIKLVLEFEQFGKDLHFQTDSAKLKQVLENLIVNALKFTQDGQVCIGCRLQNDKLYFFVEDTGVGIPEDKIDLIFKRFHQEENFMAQFQRGAGLGLSICKRLVELLGGEIGAISEVNKGSRFWFTIPFSDSSASEASPTE